jgi:hypothetical protein
MGIGLFVATQTQGSSDVPQRVPQTCGLGPRRPQRSRPRKGVSEVGWNLSKVVGETEWGTPLKFAPTFEGAVFEG